MRKKISYSIPFTTNEKSDIVALKNFIASISNCKNNNEIRRIILEKKWKKNKIIHK
jgi:hypothetical protein